MKKKLILVVAYVIFCLSFTGCFDSKEIDDFAYVVSVGFDKAKTNFLKMTFQIAVPKSISGGGDGGGGSGDKSIIMATIEAPSIYSGFNMLNSYISKEINLSHAKQIVFSKELAQDGSIGKYMPAIIRGREFRPSMYIAVSRGTAEEYIKTSKPKLEIDPAKFNGLRFLSYKYTGLTYGTKLKDFYDKRESVSEQPIATLVGMNKFDSSNKFETKNILKDEIDKVYPLEGDFKAGEIPETGGTEGELMGLAVFKNDKMLGELDGEESRCFLLTTGKYDHAYWSVPDPGAKDDLVVMNIKQARKPSCKVSIIDGKPKVDMNIKLEGDFVSIQSKINYEDPKKVELIEKKVEESTKNGIQKFLNRTTQEFNSDICGFGSKAKSNFSTWSKFLEYDWESKYRDTKFNVTIDFKVRRPGLIMGNKQI